MIWRFFAGWPFVSRDRFEAERAEVAYWRRRCAHLEAVFERSEQRGVSLLNAVLAKQGMYALGEQIQPFVSEAPAKWTSLDERVYSSWASEYMQHTGATEKETRAEYDRIYPGQLPTNVLLNS